MSVRIAIPEALRHFVGGRAHVEVAGPDVRSALRQLGAAYPGVLAKLCDDSGNVRRFVQIYVDAEDIRFRDNLATRLAAGAELRIVPAVAAGWY